MRVGYVGKEMVHHMMIEAPADDIGQSAAGGVIRGGGKDMVDKIIFIFAGGKLVHIEQMRDLFLRGHRASVGGPVKR